MPKNCEPIINSCRSYRKTRQRPICSAFAILKRWTRSRKKRIGYNWASLPTSAFSFNNRYQTLLCVTRFRIMFRLPLHCSRYPIVKPVMLFQNILIIIISYILWPWLLANVDPAEAANGTKFEIRIRKRKKCVEDRDNFGSLHHQPFMKGKNHESQKLL